MTHVFIVGSSERCHFVADRVFSDLQEAIHYCDSRKNAKYAWRVMEAHFGDDYLGWEVVHRTERT